MAGLLAGALVEAVRALVGGSAVQVSDVVGRGTVFGVVMVIVRRIEYRVRTRATNSP